MAIQHSGIRNADFFVHPDYHRANWWGREFPEAIVGQYEDALRKRIDTSALPILVYNPDKDADESEFWGRFAPENRFPSIPGNGILSRDLNVHNVLNSLLQANEVTGAIVHGSFLEACVTDFRANLLTGHDQTLYVRPPEQEQTHDSYEGPDTVQYGITLSLEEAQPIPEFAASRAGLLVGNFAVGAEIFFC